MPGGDRTGPWGFGPMSGRAAGYCAGFGLPGYANPILGRGYGAGFFGGRGGWHRGIGGRGRGWRNMFYATGLPGWLRYGRYAPPYAYQIPFQKPDPEMEMQALRNQAQFLKEELDFIEKRINEIKTSTDEERG